MNRRPRITFEITPAQWQALHPGPQEQELIPWGLASRLFQAALDDLISMLQTDRDHVVSALLNRQIRFRDLAIAMKEAELGAERPKEKRRRTP